jgi:hypothetical protein
MDNTIHCIGDSHASFFSGRNSMQPVWPDRSADTLPFFTSYRLGAVLAYSLPDLNTTMRGREKLIQILDQLPRGSRVLFGFGEIDCRVHLLKQVEKQSEDIETVVKNCVERYIGAIAELKRDFQIIIWGVIPSTTAKETTNVRFPQYGSCLERNKVTKIFNKHLENLAHKHGFLFVTVFDQLVHKNGLTNDAYYIDQVHLSQRAMPFTIRALARVIPDIQWPSEIKLFALKYPWLAKTLLYKFSTKLKILVRKIVFGLISENLWRKIRGIRKP